MHGESQTAPRVPHEAASAIGPARDRGSTGGATEARCAQHTSAKTTCASAAKTICAICVEIVDRTPLLATRPTSGSARSSKGDDAALESGQQSGQAAARNLDMIGSLASARSRERMIDWLNNVTTAGVSETSSGSKRVDGNSLQSPYEVLTDLVRLVKR